MVIRLVRGKTEVAANLFLHVRSKFGNKYVKQQLLFLWFVYRAIYLSLEASLFIQKKKKKRPSWSLCLWGALDQATWAFQLERLFCLPKLKLGNSTYFKSDHLYFWCNKCGQDINWWFQNTILRRTNTYREHVPRTTEEQWFNQPFPDKTYTKYPGCLNRTASS